MANINLLVPSYNLYSYNKELSYQNAMMLDRDNNFPSDISSEASDMMNRIQNWFTPDTPNRT